MARRLKEEGNHVRFLSALNYDNKNYDDVLDIIFRQKYSGDVFLSMTDLMRTVDEENQRKG